jgi:hypothetical protein
MAENFFPFHEIGRFLASESVGVSTTKNLAELASGATETQAVGLLLARLVRDLGLVKEIARALEHDARDVAGDGKMRVLRMWGYGKVFVEQNNNGS